MSLSSNDDSNAAKISNKDQKAEMVNKGSNIIAGASKDRQNIQDINPTLTLIKKREESFEGQVKCDFLLNNNN